MSEWLSVKEAAERLGVAPGTIYALVGSKQLACYRIGPNGGRIRFTPSDLEAYVEGTRSGPRVKPPVLPKPSWPKPKYDHGY